MKYTIKDIKALEIMDSRGFPTIRVYVTLDNDITTYACVPSGTSMGRLEALELRDNDTTRYNGKGVLKAIRNVEEIIAPEIRGMDIFMQSDIDQKLIELDGTDNKSVLGANAVVGVSMAVCRSASKAAKMPLYKYLGGVGAGRIPVPMMNIINGGQHADNSVDFQEFMAVPIGADSFREGLRYISETFHTLKTVLKERNHVTCVGDEGGFAPNLENNEQAVEVIIEAIERAGYSPGEDISIAIDSAASHFSPDNEFRYDLQWSGQGPKTSEDLIRVAEDWAERFPIILWEDPLSDGDWDGFQRITERCGNKMEIMGDDIFVTNTRYISRGIEEHTANSCLIKPNQIGTITETIKAVHMCRAAGWSYCLSNRSGETEDNFLADLAVAMDGGRIKTGSVNRSERIAKYNRLLEIEHELGNAAAYYWK